MEASKKKALKKELIKTFHNEVKTEGINSLDYITKTIREKILSIFCDKTGNVNFEKLAEINAIVTDVEKQITLFYV